MLANAPHAAISASLGTKVSRSLPWVAAHDYRNPFPAILNELILPAAARRPTITALLRKQRPVLASPTQTPRRIPSARLPSTHGTPFRYELQLPKWQKRRVQRKMTLPMSSLGLGHSSRAMLAADIKHSHSLVWYPLSGLGYYLESLRVLS